MHNKTYQFKNFLWLLKFLIFTGTISESIRNHEIRNIKKQENSPVIVSIILEIFL